MQKSWITAQAVAALSVAGVTVVASANHAWADADYTVKAGDSCLSIVTKQMGSRSGIDAFHKVNPQLGKLPHKLVPGQVVKIPSNQQAADAKLSDAKGSVKVREPKATDWQGGQLGQDLFRAWRVNTATRSSAEITFRNTSQLEMREDTVVIIYGADATRTKIDAVDVELESGALRGKLRELSGESKLAIATPGSGISGLVSDFLVSVDKTGTSLVANHGTRAFSVTGRDKTKKPVGKAVSVAPDFGTRVQPGKAAETPRPLPTAPTWAATQLAVLGSPNATIAGQWAPVARAAKYRIELLDSNKAADTATVIEVPGNASRFEIVDAPPGVYTARVAALDVDGLESKASSELKITVGAVGITGAVNGGIALGGSLTPPNGQTCALDDAAPSGAAQLVSTPGQHVYRCGDAVFTFATAPVTATLIQGAPLQPGAPGQIEVRVDGPTAAAPQFDSTDITLTDATFVDGVLRATVTLAQSQAVPVVIGQVAVGTVDVQVAPPAPPPPAPVVTGPGRYEAGVSLLVQPRIAGRDELRPARNNGGDATFGDAFVANAFIGAALAPWAGIEADAGVTTIGLDDSTLRTNAQLLTGSIHANGRLGSGGLQLRGQLGLGVRYDVDGANADAFAAVGGVLLFDVTPNSGLRLDFRDIIVKADGGGVAHRGELGLGVFGRFGGPLGGRRGGTR